MRRMMMKIAVVVAAAMALGVAVSAEQFKIGGPVNVATPTRISELYASPDRFVGKTIRIDGSITAVCQEMGCWVAVTNGDPLHPDQSVRFQAEHDGKIVFPITMKGAAGSFQGEFVQIGADDHEAKEAAAEHAHAEPKTADLGSRYQIKVTGAVVTTRD